VNSIYVMRCGCELGKDQLTTSKKGKYECQKHPGMGIKNIIRKCADCPIVMILTTRGWSKKRCDECGKKRKRLLSKKSFDRFIATIHDVRIRVSDDEKAASETWDCKNRNDCLDAMKNKMAKCLPCNGCDEYQPWLA
jgi:hypothetical protein